MRVNLLWGALLCVSSVAYGGGFKKINENERLLVSYPFLMSHDAATGELVEERDHIVAEWAKTQSVGLVGQLECGARSFDYRPFLDGETLYAHHGGIIVRKPMEESIQEVIEWSKTNQNDLVVFFITSFDGDDDCEEESIALLKRMGIYTITDCDDLSDLTYAAAKEAGKLSSGGSIIAIDDCVDSNYDSTINCYGNDYVCYDSWPENTSDIPWDALKADLFEVTGTDPTVDNPTSMWMAQAHWQSTALSIALGTLHNSSLLLDESRAGVNSWVVDAINGGQFKYLNYLEVDNVCDNGPAIYDALKKQYNL